MLEPIKELTSELKEKIVDLIQNKYVKKNNHPDFPLFIYNYTERCIFDNKWTDEILQFRGLITDFDHNIIARPFPRFENFNPQNPIKKHSRIMKKFDGSLGILYFYEEKPYIATRGCFKNIQTEKAEKMLYEKYKEAIPLLDPEITYLFEIIFPENRIVIDYGKEEELILLAMIHTKTGKEIWPLCPNLLKFFKTPELFEFQDLKILSQQNVNNEEGYVVVYEDGSREKIKFEEYIKLHALVTGVTPYRIFNLLRTNTENIDDHLKGIPDELFDEIKIYIKETQAKFRLTKFTIVSKFKSIKKSLEKKFNEQEIPRKEYALQFRETASKLKDNTLLPIFFFLLDGRDISDFIWDKLEPSADLNFKCNKF